MHQPLCWALFSSAPTRAWERGYILSWWCWLNTAVATLRLPVIRCWQHLFWPCSNSANQSQSLFIYPTEGMSTTQSKFHTMNTYNTHKVKVFKTLVSACICDSTAACLTGFPRCRQWVPKVLPSHPWQVYSSTRHVCPPSNPYNRKPWRINSSLSASDFRPAGNKLRRLSELPHLYNYCG